MGDTIAQCQSDIDIALGSTTTQVWWYHRLGGSVGRYHHPNWRYHRLAPCQGWYNHLDWRYHRLTQSRRLCHDGETSWSTV